MKEIEKRAVLDLPLISVITIVYNGRNILENTIKSVLSQSYSNIEYVIIDGGSTDGTLEVINKFQGSLDYWISEKDAGIYDAMNKGIDCATGEWVIYMNAGDSFYNDGIVQKVVSEISINTHIDILYGDVMLDFGCNLKAFKKSDHTKLVKLDSHNTICHQAAFVRLNVLKKLKFNNLKYSMDLDFWTRCFQCKLEFKHVNLVVCNYEVGGVSSNPRTALEVMFEHRVVKMLWLKKYSSDVLFSLLWDLFLLKGKLLLKSLLGEDKYRVLKKLLRNNKSSYFQ